MPLEEIIVGREPSDVDKYGKAGCVFLGKHVVGTGFDTHMANPVLLDVVRPHIYLIVGKRGSGKSYSGAIISEEIMKLPDEVKQNLSVLMVDIMGIFWSMKNSNERDLLLLKSWGLDPRGFSIESVVPIGLEDLYKTSGVPYDSTFSVRPSELSIGDWLTTFDLNLFSPLGILLDRIIKKFSDTNFSIENIVDMIGRDERAEEKEKLALQNRFLSAKEWGIFSDKATPIENFLKPGITVVLDVSLMEWSVRNLALGILARKIYASRTAARREEEASIIAGEETKKVPMSWIIIDEAHNFIPSDGKTSATEPMLTLIRQGRQPGISLVLITQRPNKLHEDAISQSDLILAHRLTAKPDLDALSSVMQTYLLEDIKKSIADMPKTKGAAVVLDDNSERLFSIQVRPRQSWHAGGSPIALKEKKQF
ncbi:MAG TPA: ATP-binding protein [archaeon]|nr:ATP-binding protein [archaeon]